MVPGTETQGYHVMALCSTTSLRPHPRMGFNSCKCRGAHFRLQWDLTEPARRAQDELVVCGVFVF